MSLRSLRKKAHLTQFEVAQELGVQQSMISRWERDADPIAEKHLAKLAELYGVTVDQLREWVYSPEQTAKAPETWRDHVIDSELSPYAQLVLIVISTFRDAKLGVSSFGHDDLWARARIPEGDRKAVWKEVLESGFLRRVGSGEWTFELVYPY